MEGPSTTPKLASTEVPVLVDEPPETPPSVDLGLVDTPHEAGDSQLPHGHAGTLPMHKALVTV